MDNSDLNSVHREKHTVANSESFKLCNFFFNAFYSNIL